MSHFYLFLCNIGGGLDSNDQQSKTRNQQFEFLVKEKSTEIIHKLMRIKLNICTVSIPIYLLLFEFQ